MKIFIEPTSGSLHGSFPSSPLPSPSPLSFIPLEDPSSTISRNGRPFVRMIGKSIGKMIGWLVGQNGRDLLDEITAHEQDKYVSWQGGGMVKEATEISINPDEDPFPLPRASRFSFRN